MLAHRAWLVDLDGTLYSPTLVKLGMASELLLFGARSTGPLRAFRREHEALRKLFEENEAHELDTSPFEEQLARAASAHGISKTELQRLVQEWMLDRPGKWLRVARRRKLLLEIATFRNLGGLTALVSDYPAEKKLEALGCRQNFDAVVASGEHPRLRRLKPSPQGFLLAAEELGVAPSSCLVIGDRWDADGKAAERAGMDFRWVR